MALLRRIVGLLSVVVGFVLITISCDKFESDIEVPSYIRIDSVGLTTEYDVQGTASHNITDAWLIVNNKLIGTFELPAIIPVLEEGPQKVEVRAGVKQNGISGTRIPYPFYKPFVVEDFMLYPDSVVKIDVTVEYYDETFFAWMEDFEKAGEIKSIEQTAKSDTAIKKTDAPGIVFQGKYSGLISLTEEKDLYEGAMRDAVELPTLGRPVYMELNYKINNITTVGLFSQMSSQIVQDPILNINSTDTWKKIYINLTPTINRNSTAFDYKVFIGSVLQSDLSGAEILIDNIKLVHFKYR